MFVDVWWNIYLYEHQSQIEAREKAEVLAGEMRAVWDFLDINQGVVNRNEDGSFRTKTLVCVVAAKSVSALFTSNSDYVIRYTNLTPRQLVSAPDHFEERAFAAFEKDPTLRAYYRVETDESGRRVFRYAEPLFVTETCLECHGEPVGELDQYGFKKEGMIIGDIGGALSIIEPMDIYSAGMRASITQQVIMVLIALLAAGVAIYFAVSKIVLQPLDKLRQAARQIGDGGDESFGYSLDLEVVGGSDELTEFAEDFNKMARQLELLYTDLESEVQSKTDKLSDLNALLVSQKTELKETLDRLSEETLYKNEFFAIMSHELRTPLTSILAFARILEEDSSLDNDTRHAIDEIETNASLLLNMVNNILIISKAEAQKDELVVEPVDFVDLIGLIKSSLEPLAKSKGIRLTARAEADVPVSMADWEKLRRIVENLVGNAIKYTHKGGEINVHVRFAPDFYQEEVKAHHQPKTINEDLASGSEPTPGVILIEVSDDGIGMTEEEQENVFEIYRQAKQSPNRRYRGTGLGLAVVKELTELHGGTVSLRSERKQGSTFTVCIPYIPVRMEEYDEDTSC